MADLGFEPLLTSDKRTHYLLDFGDFKRLEQNEIPKKYIFFPAAPLKILVTKTMKNPSKILSFNDDIKL